MALMKNDFWQDLPNTSSNFNCISVPLHASVLLKGILVGIETFFQHHWSITLPPELVTY